MKSWRLNWAFAEIADRSNFYRHSEALHSPWRFWLALVAKFVPRLWAFPIQLRLKRGGIVNVKDFMTLYIYKEIFVDKCYDYPALSDQEPCIIDVGANTGLFAIRMKQLYPRAHLLCYEPFPPNFDQLKHNLKQSRFDNCSLFKKGVGGITRTEQLFIHDKNIGGHSIYQNQSSGRKSVEIEIVDLREVLTHAQRSICDLLKLDCEGAEYEIIKRIDREMAGRIARIVFEATPAIYDVKELVKHLEACGYNTEIRNGLCVAVHESVRRA